jgi:hypothetical protein
MQEGNEGSPMSAIETCADFVQLQSIKRTLAGYTQSIPPTSLTVKNYMHV